MPVDAELFTKHSELMYKVMYESVKILQHNFEMLFSEYKHVSESFQRVCYENFNLKQRLNDLEAEMKNLKK